LNRGFHQSTSDPCLFIRNDCIIALYTDDCCVFATDNAIINELIRSLSEEFVLQDKGSIEDYLGIHVDQQLNPDGSINTITLTQSSLIDTILTDLGITYKTSRPNAKDVPILEVLHPHPDAVPYPKTAPNYRSIIGKLNFLAQSARPDISYAVNSCARYLNNPNQMYYLAAKQIGHYLYGTRMKGLILTPTPENRLSAYVDSDFAGSWSKLTSHLRHSALSRAGFVIMYSGCPIHWVSKLESEIALSTCKTKYIALSMCARALIPLRRILDELSKWFFRPNGVNSFDNIHSMITMCQLQSIIYEDNATCLAIANDTTSLTGPRTRHLSIKWHHFKDQILTGSIHVEKITSLLNWADIFTKPLTVAQFRILRKLLLGW